jgi:hypothetical protein
MSEADFCDDLTGADVTEIDSPSCHGVAGCQVLKCGVPSEGWHTLTGESPVMVRARAM